MHVLYFSISDGQSLQPSPIFYFALFWQPSLQSNQQPLLSKDKSRPQVNLGSASPWNVIFHLQCSEMVGQWEGHPACKKADVVLLVVTM